MGKQYDDFLSKDNFLLAYARVKTAPRNDYKEFYYRDFDAFEYFLDDNIAQLIHEIKEGIFAPTDCEKYYMPKKNNLARPITLLSLTDLIVYQAISNIIADKVFNKLSKYFNVHIYGNIFKTSNDPEPIFFFQKWKDQWKRYNNQKRIFYKNGYEFSADFDIASYYDTIDHSILFEILKEFNIDNQIISLLNTCLKAWTTTSSAKIYFTKSCGIPQGPISSSFFAELYLYKLDEEMRRMANVKYFRYADDISIMSRTEQECKKSIVYLDLLARDLSLIPQSEKIGVEHIVDIDKFLNRQLLRFSKIVNEHRKSGILKSKTHKQLKQKIKQCLTERSIDKTLFRFSLYKLNKDDELKNLLLKNLDLCEWFYAGIIYYFNKYYPGDKDFMQQISSYLLGDTVLFQYNKSLLFKSYDHLPYNEEIFRTNFKNEQRFWIVQYHLVLWLTKCNKQQLAVETYDGNNYYVMREIDYIKSTLQTDQDAKKIFLEALISDENILISLHGLYLWFHFFNSNPVCEPKNGFSKRILKHIEADYFCHTMNMEYGLSVPSTLLNILNKDNRRFNELKEELRCFLVNRTINPSISLMALDLMHNILFDIIVENESLTPSDFGAGLGQLTTLLPITQQIFKCIHEMRNQKTWAHYKDKNGNPRVKISSREYKQLLEDNNLKDAYNEIFGYYD